VKDLRIKNPYCTDLHFLGVEARARAEGITVIPRMVDQVQHFDRMQNKNKSNYIHIINTISSFLTHVLAPLAPAWDLKTILLHIQFPKELCHPL